MVSLMDSSTDAPQSSGERRELVFAVLGAADYLQRTLDRSLSGTRGITISEYRLLAALGARSDRPATRVDLATSVGLTPSGVTRALRPLEKLGFVETTRSERDARQSLAGLTKDGRELLADAEAIIDDTVESLPALRALDDDSRLMVKILGTIR